MHLSQGVRLGHYQIASLIGKGGMGEVYRATDTRLDRPVAIKISTREFNDRYEREARAISALNHPNICTLYDVGTSPEAPGYLVMELVEGEMLSKIIERGPLPLDKALAYAVQIVDALASAHAKGVIHRDLKPGNVIITRNGVKVLDFGLARFKSEPHPSPSADNMATVTEPITQARAVLGTLHYMSPEQVEGKEADERSDIFSFGVVLYEMITGQRPFTGDTQAAILASLMKDQPPPMNQRQPTASSLPANVPRALERVVRKCLEKKPEDRWQSARDLKPTLELIDLDAPPVGSTSSTPIPVQPPAPAKSRRKWLWSAAGIAAALVIAAMGYALWFKPAATARVARFEVALPPDAGIAPNNFWLRISPDGNKIAFTASSGKRGIWVRDLESVQARLLAGTEGATTPFWSPDSKSIAYSLGNRLMRVEVAGGPPQVLCESATPVGSGWWTKDGQIVFGGQGTGPLQKVSAAGGVPAPLTVLASGESFHSLPSPLPDGRRFLYLRPGGMYVGSLDAKPDQQSKKQVAPAQFAATFAEANNSVGGVLFFVRDGTLMAQPFDSKAESLTGDPVPVVQQIGTGRSHAHFSVTATGTMAYRTGPGTDVQPTWLDRKGALTPQKIGRPSGRAIVSLSPNESQVALFRSDTNSLTAGDIWLLDIARNVEARLTTGQTVAVNGTAGAVWSPDNKQIAYASGAKLYVKDVGGATEARLIKDVGQPLTVTDWTRDGRFLLFDTRDGDSAIFAAPAQGGEPTSLIAQKGASIRLARVSPDGRWMAYDSTQSGRREVYVRPFTAPGSGTAPAGPVIQISAAGGNGPQWSADGKELFFRASDNTLRVAAIDRSNGGFRPAAAVTLGPLPQGGWSVERTGQRILVAAPSDLGSPTPITVVTNWEATLKRN